MENNPRSVDGLQTYAIRAYSPGMPIIDILESLDDSIEELVYDGPGEDIKVYHKKDGFLRTGIFPDEGQVNRFIEEMQGRSGKSLSPQSPFLDCAVEPRFRVNITVPPASKGVRITVRRFASDPLTVAQMVNEKVLTAKAASFLWSAVEGLGTKPMNILIVGGTASGKTTFLNALTSFIPPSSRVITIEDTAEVRLAHENWVQLLASGGVPMESLVKNSLRMRPDRLIVGEVRGSDAIAMFEAMNTGHGGCLGTLHANSSIDAITRLRNPPLGVPTNMLSYLNLVVVLKKTSLSGHEARRVDEIVEVVWTPEGKAGFNQLYAYDPKKDSLLPTGIPSRIRSEISKAAGISMLDLEEIERQREAILSSISVKGSDLVLTYNRVFAALGRYGLITRGARRQGLIGKAMGLFRREQIIL